MLSRSNRRFVVMVIVALVSTVGSVAAGGHSARPTLSAEAALKVLAEAASWAHENYDPREDLSVMEMIESWQYPSRPTTIDVEEAMRAALDASAVAVAFGKGLQWLSERVPSELAGWLHEQGRRISGFAQSGHGKVDYWLTWTRTVTRAVRGTGEALAAKAECLHGRRDLQVALVDVLYVVERMGCSYRWGGYGKAPYWRRASSDTVYIANAMSRALSMVAAEAPEDTERSLVWLATSLQRLSMPYSTGDVDYWIAVAERLGERFTSLMTSLVTTRTSLHRAGI